MQSAIENNLVILSPVKGNIMEDPIVFLGQKRGRNNLTSSPSIMQPQLKRLNANITISPTRLSYVDILTTANTPPSTLIDTNSLTNSNNNNHNYFPGATGPSGHNYINAHLLNNVLSSLGSA